MNSDSQKATEQPEQIFLEEFRALLMRHDAVVECEAGKVLVAGPGWELDLTDAEE